MEVEEEQEAAEEEEDEGEESVQKMALLLILERKEMSCNRGDIFWVIISLNLLEALLLASGNMSHISTCSYDKKIKKEQLSSGLLRTATAAMAVTACCRL